MSEKVKYFFLSWTPEQLEIIFLRENMENLGLSNLPHNT